MRKIFTFLLLVTFTFAHARQQLTRSTHIVPGKFWKKRVERKIRLLPGGENIEWEPFFRQLIGAVRKNVLTAYSAAEYNKGAEVLMSASEREQLAKTAFDTSLIDSPVGRQFVKIERREFNFRNIQTWRITEEWCYNTQTAQTTVEITEIAPAADIIIDGDNRGAQPLFWLKWKDLVTYCTLQKKTKELGVLARLIWQDYLHDTTIIQKETTETPIVNRATVMKAGVLRMIKMPAEFSSEFGSQMQIVRDSPKAAVLYNACIKGKLQAYAKYQCRASDVMPADTVRQLFRIAVDSETKVDIVTGSERVIVQKKDFCFGCIGRFIVAEKWVFNVQLGKLAIRYSTVALVKDSLVHGRDQGIRPMFWMKYDDLRKALARYNEYHSENSIEWELWNERYDKPQTYLIEQR